MLDFSHIPTPNGAAEVYYFEGSAPVTGGTVITWQQPRGKSMIDIFLVGSGGNGGNGAVGANSAAAGGGGGAAGNQARLTMPLALIPNTLYISLVGVGGTGGTLSNISIQPKMTAGAGAPTANAILMQASSGSAGGNATGATAGSAGTAGSLSGASNMPLGWAYSTVLAGQAGIIGGVAVAGGALTLPVTGIRVTGGTGGGGVPAAAASGTAGGSFTVAGSFPAHAGGATQATATNPGNPGAHGYRPVPGLIYGYGGTGGSSSHGTATGDGLFGGNGGNGAPGCGGGGGGGCLTGGTAGIGGLGGPAFCIITCW